MRDRGHGERGSKVRDAPKSDPSSESDDTLISEEKRLRVRRRFLKGGIGGATAVILSVYQRPSLANHDDKQGKGPEDTSKKMSVFCKINGDGRKVGVSVCMSIGVKKG